MKTNFRIAPRNLVLSGIAVLGILAYGLLALFPVVRAAGEADRKILVLEDSLHTQEVLQPVYSRLRDIVSRKGPDSLHLPESRKLSRDQAEQLRPLFAELVKTHQLKMLEFLPVSDAYDPGKGQLPVKIRVRGSLHDFRSLLMSLAERPYLEGFREVTIQAKGDLREMTIRLLLAVGEEGEAA